MIVRGSCREASVGVRTRRRQGKAKNPVELARLGKSFRLSKERNSISGKIARGGRATSVSDLLILVQQDGGKRAVGHLFYTSGRAFVRLKIRRRVLEEGRAVA